MAKNQTSIKDKLKALIFPFIYLALTITLAVSVFVTVRKKSYISIYIDGTSMQPTLNANVHHESDGSYTNTEYGYADQSTFAKNNLQRFNIVLTYYPSDYFDDKLLDTADYKIKRVVALPGETFSIRESVLTVINDEGTFTWDFKDSESIPFSIKRNSHQKDHALTTLGENEYWVLGDNWNVSSDSHSVGPIKSEYIAGVLVAIQGTCTINTTYDSDGNKISHFTDYKKYDKPRYYI